MAATTTRTARKTAEATQLVPAVAYYRMSSDEQTDSIPQQRNEVRAYAARNGYRIVREYVDAGKSGSKDQDRRTEFQRLLMDASQGDFRAVLTWDVSRFGRTDAIDGAFAKQILRAAGVHLDTVTEGKIDWSTSEGRWKDMALAETAHMFSRSLSKNTVRGRVDTMRAGFWPFGSVPYGYRRCYVFGDQTHVVSRSDKWRKPRDWNLKLVKDDTEAEVVRRIFTEFVVNGKSLRHISRILNTEGIPGPDVLGRRAVATWDKDTVRGIIRQPAYIGRCVVGARRKRTKTTFTQMPDTTVEGVCPVLIDTDTWNTAQTKLAEFAEGNPGTKSEGASWLTGALICGHCQYRMARKVAKRMTCEQCGKFSLSGCSNPSYRVCSSCGHKNPADRPFVDAVYYVCSSATTRPELGCRQWRVYESDVLGPMLTHLEKNVDAALVKLSTPKAGQPVSNAEVLAAHVETLRKKVQTAARRVAAEDDDNLVADLRAVYQQLRGELAEAEERLTVLAAVESQGGLAGFRTKWNEMRTKLRFLVPSLADQQQLVDKLGKDEAAWSAHFASNPFQAGVHLDEFRGLLSRVGATMTLWWKEIPKGKRKGKQCWELDRGRLRAELRWDDTKKDIKPSKNSPAGRSSTSSRARSRGTG